MVSGTLILSENNGTNTTYYFYDESGSPIGLIYKGMTFYYRKNLQGDIIAILNSSGTEVVNYSYNAWGRLVSMTGNMELGANNPFKYRGYYYDVESGLYYLNSSYYDPVTGRWINPEPNVDKAKFDDGAGLQCFNVYAYCANNPVVYKDYTGEFAISISIGVGSLITWAVYGIATAVGVGVVVGDAISNEISKSKNIDIVQSKPTTSNKRLPIAKRYRYKSKKDAKEAAKKAGGGREPIHHPNGKNGPHYHPDVPFRRNLTPNMPTPHDHYYYPKGK